MRGTRFIQDWLHDLQSPKQSQNDLFNKQGDSEVGPLGEGGVNSFR